MRNGRIDFFDRTPAATAQRASIAQDNVNLVMSEDALLAPQNNSDFFNKLPKHLIETCIVSWLGLKSIFAFALTCKLAKKIVDDFMVNPSMGDLVGDFEIQVYRTLTKGKPSTIDLGRVFGMSQTKFIVSEITWREDIPDHVWEQAFYIRVLAWFVLQNPKGSVEEKGVNKKIVVLQKGEISEQEMYAYKILTAENLDMLTQDQVASIFKTRLFGYVQDHLKARDSSMVRDKAFPDNVMAQLFYLEMLSFAQEDPIEKLTYQTLTAETPDVIDKEQIAAIMKTKVYKYVEWMIECIQRCPYKVMSQMFHIALLYLIYMIDIDKEDVAYQMLIAKTPAVIKEDEAAAIVNTTVFECASTRVEKGICLDSVADQVLHIGMLSCIQGKAEERKVYQTLIAERPAMINHSDALLMVRTGVFRHAMRIQNFHPKICDQVFHIIGLCVAAGDPEELMVQKMLRCENPAEIDQNKVSVISKTKVFEFAKNQMDVQGACPERVRDRVRYIELVDKIQKAQQEAALKRSKYENSDDRLRGQMRKDRASQRSVDLPRVHDSHFIVIEIASKNRPKDMRGLDLSKVQLQEPKPLMMCGTGLMKQREPLPSFKIGNKTRYGVAEVADNGQQTARFKR